MNHYVNLVRIGRSIDSTGRTYLINKAMDVTKSDPNAAPGKYDPLKEIGQLIFRKSLLPTNHRGLEATVWSIFEGGLSISRRAHAHERDIRLWDISKTLISLASFFRQGVISAEEDKKKLKQKKGIKERLSFSRKSEEEQTIGE